MPIEAVQRDGVDHMICYFYIDTEPNTNFVSHDFDSIKHIDI